jgi:hypothetical protein
MPPAEQLLCFVQQKTDKKTKQVIHLLPVKVSELEHRLEQLHFEVGHRGDLTMWAAVRERYTFLPRHWLRAIFRRCEICERRRGNQTQNLALPLYIIASSKFKPLNFIDYSKSPDGEYKYVLHLVDNVSKMHYAIRTRSKEAKEVVLI